MKEIAPRIGESIVVNHEVVVTVVDISEDEVVLSIDAPEWMRVEAGQEEEWLSAVPR